MSEERVRAFVALPMDAAARDRVAAAVAPLRARVQGLRWAPALQGRDSGDTLHVTLRFLGDASRPTLEALREPLARAAAACPPAAVPFTGLGLFPDRGAPRVLWLGVGLTAPMLELQAGCEAAAVAAGFAAERRPFTPHLTLGRWRSRSRRPELPSLSLGEARLDTLVLFRSQLGSGGARHTPLVELALG